MDATGWIGLAASTLSSLCCALLLWYHQRSVQRQEKRAEARRRESLLALRLQMNTADLAYATAKAVRDNRVNGEITAAIAEYRAAKRAYTDFLNEQAKRQMTA